jgi:hypothetical protein
MRKNRPEQTHLPPIHPFLVADLVTGTTGLSDDTLELVDLRLGTAESSELVRC